jgi:putative membrane protein
MVTSSTLGRRAVTGGSVRRGTLAAVLDDGDDDDGEGAGEPDYRFTLANERTFLAWIRTSLALLAAGVAVRFLAEPFEVEGGRQAMAVAAILLSAACVVLAYRRWAEIQDAMRDGRPLPASVGVPLLAVALTGIAVGAAVLVLIG